MELWIQTDLITLICLFIYLFIYKEVSNKKW